MEEVCAKELKEKAKGQGREDWGTGVRGRDGGGGTWGRVDRKIVRNGLRG
jgi:hypothetical protein